MGEHVLQVRGDAQSGLSQEPRMNKKARALWALRNVREKEEAYHDPSGERQIES